MNLKIFAELKTSNDCNECNCSFTLGHSQNSKHSHPGVPLPVGVCHVLVRLCIIGPVTEPQVLTDESNVLDEVTQEDHGRISPAHGTQVLEVHGELHLEIREKKSLRKRFLFSSSNFLSFVLLKKAFRETKKLDYLSRFHSFLFY